MSLRHLRLVIAMLAVLLAFVGTAVLATENPIQEDLIDIDRVAVQVGNGGTDGRTAVTAHVEGSAQYGCDRVVHDPVVSQKGSEVTVQIWVEWAPSPPGTLHCTGYILRPVIQDINLGSFETGSHNLRVNDYSTTFTVPGGPEEGVIECPLWSIFAWFFGN